MEEIFTAFVGHRHIASGPVEAVALAAKRATTNANEPILIFSDVTGREIDFDLRGDERDVVARLATLPSGGEEAEQPSAPRGRGRPKLGVVAREVTLLPRHWEWLNAQSGGASVALRKLVDEARRASGENDRERRERDAAYHFMSAMAGNMARFEEAARALFANDRKRLVELIADWPADIRNHIVKLAAYGDRD